MADTEADAPEASTRERLIEGAFELISRKGYHATSMRDIARAAGITAPSIYNHFADKSEIVRAVILAHHPFVRLAPVLDRIEGEDVAGIVQNFARLVAEDVDRQPGVMAIIFVELTELGGTHLDDLIPNILPAVAGFLDRVYALDDGRLPKDRLLFMRGLAAQLLGYLVTRKHFEPAGTGSGREALIAQFLNGALAGRT